MGLVDFLNHENQNADYHLSTMEEHSLIQRKLNQIQTELIRTIGSMQELPDTEHTSGISMETLQKYMIQTTTLISFTRKTTAPLEILQAVDCFVAEFAERMLHALRSGHSYSAASVMEALSWAVLFGRQNPEGDNPALVMGSRMERLEQYRVLIQDAELLDRQIESCGSDSRQIRDLVHRLEESAKRITEKDHRQNSTRDLFGEILP